MKKMNLTMGYASLAKKVFLLIVCVICLKGEGKAEIYTFDGFITSNHWTDPTNWVNFNYPGLTVNADDTVYIKEVCLIPDLATVTNYGKIILTSTGNGGSYFDFYVDGRLEIYGDVEGFNQISQFIIHPGGEVIIAAGGNLWLRRGMTIEAGADLVNGGTLDFQSGDFDILGNFFNSGLSILKGNTTNYPTGLIYNTDEINLQNFIFGVSWSQNTFDNLGTITNRPTAAINNSVSFTNHLTGQITNQDNATFLIDDSFGNPLAFINSGTITNNAALGSSPPGEFSIKLDFTNNLTFNNYGKITIDVGSVFNQQLVFVNQIDGEITINDGTFNVELTFTNAGLINVNNSGDFNINTTFNNSGDININPGGNLDNNSTFNNSKNLTINQGGTIVNDDFLNHQVGGNFQIHGFFTNNDVFWNADNVFIGTDGNVINNNTFNNYSTSTFGCSGLFTSISSGFILNNGTFNNYSAGSSTIAGTFNGPGDILNNGAFQLSGTLTSDGEFTNNGTLNINTTGSLINNDLLNNTNDLFVNGTFINNDAHSNIGTIEIKSVGQYTNNVDFNNWSAGTFTNKGVFHNLGTHLNNGSQSTTSTGTYSGSGNVTGGIDNFFGTLSPGSSPGMITASGYLDLKSTATFKAEIAGSGAAGTPTGFDQVNTNGSSLAGTLEIILLDGFTPTSGDQYIILNSSSPITGTFDNITLPNGHDFSISYNINNVTIQYTGVLPVELISFTGRMKDNHVQLDWQTASEFNNLGFEIQQMHRNNSWKNIGFIDGKGTTDLYQNYQFIDRTASNGDNYYRLKQIDFDGQFEFSKVVNIYLDTPSEIILYPNPLGEVLHIEGIERSSGKTIIEIFDSSGQKHYSTQLKENENLNSVDIYEVASFEEGNYFLVIRHGDETHTFNLMKFQ